MSIKQITEGNKLYAIPYNDMHDISVTAVSVGRKNTPWRDLSDEDRRWFEAYANETIERYKGLYGECIGQNILVLLELCKK